MNALTTFNFTTRETYLEFTAAWKAQHALLVTEIRAAKNGIKNAMRDNSISWKHYNELYQKRSEIQELLTLRQSAKAEAQRQYLAEHAIAA
jgi:hypothetical protein